MSRDKLGITAALAMAGLLLTQAAGAERIQGEITNYKYLVNPVWNEAKSAKLRRFTFREIVPTVPREYRRLFPHIPKEVALVALGNSKVEPSGHKVLIRVGGGRTTPVTIVVPPGTTLRFKNTDPFNHRLYLFTDDKQKKLFNAKDQAPGTTRDFTVPSAGSFEIRDERAPSLRMWIVGEPKAAAIAYPSLKGEFALTVKAPGTYTVQAYFSGKKVGPARAVEAKGKVVKLKKPIPVADKPKKKKSGKKSK